MVRTRSAWLCDRRVLAAILAIGCGLVVYFFWLARGESLPTTTQVMAKEDSRPVEVSIGPSVQVSAAHAAVPHLEVVSAADPTDPRRLLAFAMSYPHPDPSIAAVVGYRSGDGGRSWRPTFRRDDPSEHQLDPALAFGPDGDLYLVLMTRPAGELRPGQIAPHAFRFHRSPDAGNTWEVTATVAGAGLDRPFLAVDGSAGPSRGRLYCASLLQFHTSADRGRSFTPHTYVGGASATPGPSNPVVLSDGTVVSAYRSWPADKRERPGLGVLASDDGGRSLRELPPVTARWQGEPFETRQHWFLPQLGVDASGGEFRDRLYAVWEDGNGPTRVRILFAYSADKGRSWAGPMILSEQPADGSAGYGAHMPAVAVNSDGVVAVTWYDRRGLPDVAGARPPHYGPGCNVRIRVSLDGGGTWQRSAQVTETPIRATVWELRDTAGLSADATGTFHPVWTDDRTGVLQVWTAAVRVGKR